MPGVTKNYCRSWQAKRSPRARPQTIREYRRATRLSTSIAECMDDVDQGPVAALSVELDLYFPVDDAHRVGLQIFGRGRVEHPSGADIKAGGVQRTLDELAVEPAVGQPGIGVGADVVGREKSAVDVVKRDRMAGDLDAERLAFGEISTAGYSDPARLVRAHLTSERPRAGADAHGPAEKARG